MNRKSFIRRKCLSIENVGDDMDDGIREYKQAIREVLTDKFNYTNYSLDGYREDAVCLEEKDGKWQVYVGYRNHKDDLKTFSSIVTAGMEMIRILSGGTNIQEEICNVFLRKIYMLCDEDFTKVTPEEKEILERIDKKLADHKNK